jgi:hypothetical protein
MKKHSHTQLWKYLQTFSALGVVKTKVSTVGSKGRSTVIYLPTIPSHELEKELTALLEREQA